MAATNSSATLESAMYRWNWMSVPGTVATPPKGIRPNAPMAQNSEMNGASRYSRGRAPSGIIDCLRSSLPRSAIGCSRPCGPTRLGPRRAWKRPISRRSTHVMTAKKAISRFTSAKPLMTVM